MRVVSYQLNEDVFFPLCFLKVRGEGYDVVVNHIVFKLSKLMTACSAIRFITT